MIGSALVGTFLGVLLAFIRQAMKKGRQDPQTAERLGQLKKVWSWR